MKPLFVRSITLAAIGALAMSATAAAILPHTHLEKSEPAKDSTVTVAPKELKLFFSEAVQPSIARIRLLASDSSVVTLGALKTGEGKPGPIVAPITGAMKAGSYRVMWRVAGDDGHPINGDYVFKVKPKAAN